jgi:two-component system OmpR family sensor kinase
VSVVAEADDAEVRVHVDDDGPGVSAEDRQRIFEPFGRGDRARSVPGLGLGLAIARATVEAHGGRISVTSPRTDDASRPGTRFTVRLPVSAAGAPESSAT